jgi:hypothetical protein
MVRFGWISDCIRKIPGGAEGIHPSFPRDLFGLMHSGDKEQRRDDIQGRIQFARPATSLMRKEHFCLYLAAERDVSEINISLPHTLNSRVLSKYHTQSSVMLVIHSA